jgi:ATP phosphoribosyltransferase
VRVTFGRRGYRPSLSLEGFETKLLKPQNIVEMLHIGSRDLGFAGADWVAELGTEVVEILDTGLDPVQVVAAATPNLGDVARLARAPFIVASEYERLTRSWLERRKLKATVVRSYGATEVFPPEDADCIVDNTATGATDAQRRLSFLDSRVAAGQTMTLVAKGMLNAFTHVQVHGTLSAPQESIVELGSDLEIASGGHLSGDGATTRGIDGATARLLVKPGGTLTLTGGSVHGNVRGECGLLFNSGAATISITGTSFSGTARIEQ